MNNSQLPVYEKTSEEIVADILDGLESSTPFRRSPEKPGAGETMAHLFGRMADILIARLNAMPENYFRTFLNDAGVDLLPPQPASAEVTFTPAKDAPDSIQVPAGTQVSAKKTEGRPEIVFETDRNLNVMKASLVSCLTADPVNFSDCTAAALGGAASSFAAFQGDTERKRIFYLKDDALFTFADDESRLRATLLLTFILAVPGRPDLDGWQVDWLYYDGSAWVPFDAASVNDATEGFSQDGVVTFVNLPAMQLDKSLGAHMACALSGGTGRRYLPMINVLTGARTIAGGAVSKATEKAFGAIHTGTAFLPLDPAGEFFPLGQRPERLDAFYLQLDGAYGAPGVTVEIDFHLVGASKNSSQLNELKVEWSYSSAAGWTTLGISTKASVRVDGSLSTFSDGTQAFTRSGSVSFTFPESAEDQPATDTAIGKEKGLWLRARVESGGYGLDPDSGSIWTAPEVLAPYVKKVEAVTYGNLPDASVAAKIPDAVRSLVDRQYSDYLFVSGQTGTFAPFTGAEDLHAFYLGFNGSFPAGEWIQLLLDVDEERTDGEGFPALVWEYYSDAEASWKTLLVSDESEGLSRRGYLGFYGPADSGKSVVFGLEAYWLRLRTARKTPRAVALPKTLTLLTPAAEATVTLDFSGSLASEGKTIAKYRLASKISDNLVAGAGEERTGENAVKTTGNTADVQLDASGSYDTTGKSPAAYRWNLVSSETLVADAGADRVILTSGGEAQMFLDASGSYDASGENLIHYRWTLKSSERLIADAGVSRTVYTLGSGATVQLDASGSYDSSGEAIGKYRWRLVEQALPEETAEEVACPAAFLKAVRWNTVPVLNAVSVYGEVLGSSNGKSGQNFATTCAPVLPDLRLYVREPDLPSAAELAEMSAELDAEVGADAESDTPLTVAADEGVWILWRPVDHFDASGAASRHYTLDQDHGRISFGDGKKGKIPPVGRDNIKTVCYRYHQGAAGNVAAGEITVLRNPGGVLAKLKTVRNAEGAAGGGDGESTDDVRLRGPYTLKHRGKAITGEDFAWLAKDAAGEIASAWCLPTRDKNGKTVEGHVTVVAVPESTDARPYPRPELLRNLHKYLAARTLANLAASGNEALITVKGPEYVEATVSAGIVPIDPEKADEVKFAVMAQLEDFLHPLAGGPDRLGWELGRDVYLSEIFAEIESVPGVDHVEAAQLAGSIQQYVLTLKLTAAPANLTLPATGRVGTFDERICLVQAGRAEIFENTAGTTVQISLYGFKISDRVNIVDAENTVLLKGAKIMGLYEDGAIVVLDCNASAAETLPPAEDLALLSTDGAIRLPLMAWRDADEQNRAVAFLELPAAGDATICIVSEGLRNPDLQFLELTAISTLTDRIFIPPGHLVCSGTHAVEMILED